MKKNTTVLICLEQAFHGYTSKINDLWFLKEMNRKFWNHQTTKPMYDVKCVFE